MSYLHKKSFVCLFILIEKQSRNQNLGLKVIHSANITLQLVLCLVQYLTNMLYRNTVQHSTNVLRRSNELVCTATAVTWQFYKFTKPLRKSHQNPSAVKIGKSPQQGGGGQELYLTFPKLRLGNADRRGRGRILFNIFQPKNLYKMGVYWSTKSIISSIKHVIFVSTSPWQNWKSKYLKRRNQHIFPPYKLKSVNV